MSLICIECRAGANASPALQHCSVLYNIHARSRGQQIQWGKQDQVLNLHQPSAWYQFSYLSTLQMLRTMNLLLVKAMMRQICGLFLHGSRVATLKIRADS